MLEERREGRETKVDLELSSSTSPFSFFFCQKHNMALPSAPLDTTETVHEMARRLGISDDDPEEYEQFNVEDDAHIFSVRFSPPLHPFSCFETHQYRGS